MQKGKLYHDFAEFYLNHPELVEAEGLDQFAELMLEKMRRFVQPAEAQKLLSEFNIGLENIIEYLEQHGLARTGEAAEKKAPEADAENVFAAEFDRRLERSRSEVWFEDRGLGVKGKIDLVQAKHHLLDYKSGRKQSLGSLVRRSNLKLFRNDVDFQAILYLSYYRREHPGEPLRFTFFYFLDNLSDVVNGAGDLGDTIVTVNYYPVEFVDKVPRKDTFEVLTTGVSESNDRRKTLEKLGFSAYNKFFRNNDFPTIFDKEELRETEIYDRFAAFCVDAVGDYAYVEKGVKKTFNHLLNQRTNNFFKEDLDQFEEFVQSNLAQINQYSRERFPVRGGIEDYDLDDLENRDLLVTGPHGT